MGHEFKVGDKVRVLDRCQVIAGRAVEINGSFVCVDHVTSTGEIAQCITLSDRVFHIDDVAGFVAYVRDRAEWMTWQASQLESANNLKP